MREVKLQLNKGALGIYPNPMPIYDAGAIIEVCSGDTGIWDYIVRVGFPIEYTKPADPGSRAFLSTSVKEWRGTTYQPRLLLHSIFDENNFQRFAKAGIGEVVSLPCGGCKVRKIALSQIPLDLTYELHYVSGHLIDER